MKRMGLVLAIITAIVTIAIAAFIMFANGMSDAPSGISPVPTLIIGFVISGVFALTHFYPVSW